MPPARGRPILIEFQKTIVDEAGEAAHAATFLRERRIVLETGLRRSRREFSRILVHELFHFVWLRLGNAKRRRYEDLLAAEIRKGARGELGWSAEWRKQRLHASDWSRRTRRWREYCCESFCDTAAWLYAGIGGHDEFTLARRFRSARRRWFGRTGIHQGISI
jgi:hypothetical protein